MQKTISSILKKVANDLIANVESLTKEDKAQLNSRCPELIKQIKENKKKETSDPFEGFSDRDKRMLLSFVIYKRQNITTEDTDNPNEEDAAKILHEKIYPVDGNKKEKKESLNNLTDDLKKQLLKAGLDVD